VISAHRIGSRIELENLFGPSVRLLQRGQNVYVRRGARTSPLILPKRGLHSPWTVRFSAKPCDLYEAQWVSTNATVIGPAGLFRHCRMLFLQQSLYSSCDTHSHGMYLYLAPDIGPVQIDRVDDQLTLASAGVNGTNRARAFTAPPLGDALTLVISPNTFTNLHYVGCGTCDVGRNMPFQLTLSNSLSQPICIARPELEFVDPVGSVMKLWSEDSDFNTQYFPQVLAPGETYVWFGFPKLHDRRGWLLRGDFQVWASIQAYPLPLNATECLLPSPNSNPIIFGAQQNISVVVRSVSTYDGGVIHTWSD
jgi:hypothetical protein